MIGEPSLAERNTVAATLEEMLEPDGYDARVLEWPGHERRRLRLQVVARERSCSGCLVPREVLTMVLASNLPANWRDIEIEVDYPDD